MPKENTCITSDSVPDFIVFRGNMFQENTCFTSDSVLVCCLINLVNLEKYLFEKPFNAKTLSLMEKSIL